MSQKITTFLWFSKRGGEAMDFYASVFKNSKIINKSNGPGGSFFMGTIQIEGQNFHIMEADNNQKFNEAISLFVNCETQDEVNYFWNKLTSEGGKESRCGWLVDKFGISWQIIPEALGRLMGDPDREKANRVMEAMLQMNKIEIEKLQAAYDGK